MNVLNGTLEIFAALVAVMLLVSVQGEAREEPFEKLLTATIVTHIMTLLVDSVRWFSDGELLPLALAASIVSTALALISNAFFVYCLIAYFAGRADQFRKILPALWALFIASAFLWSAFVLLNGEAYLIQSRQQGAALEYSWMFWVSNALWGAVCILGAGIIWSCRSVLRRHELLALLTYCIFPVLALLLKTVWDASQIYLATTLSLVLIHSVMYREHRRRLRQREKQLEQSRISVLLCQIQPHFIFNVLNTIYFLCVQNPEAAQKAVNDFSEYLRTNLDSLQQAEPICFADELRHVQTYLALEKMRFTEKLQATYDIQTTDFSLPALSLQLLVENAVKHGVSRKKGGGTVHIASREEGDCYVVTVTDDGPGFDPARMETQTPPRVGLANVRSRLSLMSGGTLEIDSEPGRGTSATLRIPKQKKPAPPTDGAGAFAATRM